MNIDKLIDDKSEDEWVRDVRFKHSKFFYSKPDKATANGTIMCMPQTILTRWIQIIIRHNLLSKH